MQRPQVSHRFRATEMTSTLSCRDSARAPDNFERSHADESAHTGRRLPRVDRQCCRIRRGPAARGPSSRDPWTTSRPLLSFGHQHLGDDVDLRGLRGSQRRPIGSAPRAPGTRCAPGDEQVATRCPLPAARFADIAGPRSGGDPGGCPKRRRLLVGRFSGSAKPEARPES